VISRIRRIKGVRDVVQTSVRDRMRE